MRNNTDFEITLSDILFLVKRRWKLLGLVALICMVLCGGYQAISSGSEQEQESNTGYMKELGYYESFQESQEKISESLMREWKANYSERNNDPVFSLNPYNCKYGTIVVSFNDEGNNHDFLVDNWVSASSDKQLFGAKADVLAAYKKSIITLSKQYESGETAVQLLAVKDFDIEKGSNYLMKYFGECAAREGIPVSGISYAEATGYNRSLFEYRKACREEMTSIYNSLEKTNNMSRFVSEPEGAQANDLGRLVHIVMYAILGLILGLGVCVVIIIAMVIRRGEVVSSRQIEDAFGIELLGDCSSGSEVALDVLNANLDVMTGEGSNIMIIAEDLTDRMKEIASSWSKECSHTFTACTNIFDDPEMIEALQDMDGVVLGVKLGKSKLHNLQRTILRVEYLKQSVLGYVLL